MPTYRTPSLADHGKVITDTVGIVDRCSVDSLLTGGSRFCSMSANDAPHVENTTSVMTSSSTDAEYSKVRRIGFVGIRSIRTSFLGG
jgi:hypothetical protein